MKLSFQITAASTLLFSLLCPNVLGGYSIMRQRLARMVSNSSNSNGPSARFSDFQIDNFFSDIHNGWGCWCYFDENSGRGRGQALNEGDALCKTMQHGYECIQLENADCTPWAADYTEVSFFVAEEAIMSTCEAANTGDNCKINSCAVETRFVNKVYGLLNVGAFKFEDNYKHENGFVPVDGCPISPGIFSSKECCGEYPTKFPFKTNNGVRKCCGDQVYESEVWMCCEDSDTIAISC